jgi:acyl carrier protein
MDALENSGILPSGANATTPVLVPQQGDYQVDQSEFLVLAAEILEVEETEVTLDSSLDEIDWDSLANISFIAEIDSKLNRSVSPEELNKCASLSDIYALISN